jgi:Leucine-rich repeat (LRR) protein
MKLKSVVGIFFLTISLLPSCAKMKASENQPLENVIEPAGNDLVLVNNMPNDRHIIIGGYAYNKSSGTEDITISIEKNKSADFTGIEKLKNLKRLRINLWEKVDIDFSPLKSLPNLEYVYLYLGVNEELPDLGGIPSLAYLEIFHSGLKNLDGIEKITQLENLLIRVPREPLTDMSALRHLKKLKIINLQNGSYNVDFSVLGDLPELEELYIANVAVDLSGISRLKSLRELSLISNVNREMGERIVYKNIEEIGSLTNLKILYLDETITSIEFLAGNVNLEELTLVADQEREGYWKNINLPLDIAPLGNLKKLKRLTIRGFDLKNKHVIDSLPELKYFNENLFDLE